MLPLTKYNISEIFYSVQGEGLWVGTPAIFIRFAGCNLACAWCDTNHQMTECLTAPELLERVRPFPSKRLILTGGEPTLQLTAELIERLHANGYVLHLETNGTRQPPTGIDWLTVSPKSPWNVRTGQELKVVYEGQDLEQYLVSDFQYYYLQPCSMKNIHETIEQVKQCPQWRLSVQMHKLLQIH